MIELYHGDCLDIMPVKIPDKSVDLILTDPPYNIGKAKWDKIPDYINWCGKWIKECERVLKDNGSFYFWHNDMAQIAQLMEWIRQNTKFVYNSFCIWDKGDFRALAWKNPSEDNNLRSWFSTCEYCLYYTFQDETGLTSVMGDYSNFESIKNYFKNEQQKINNETGAEIKSKVKWTTHFHSFAQGQSWGMCTEQNYRELQTKFAGYFLKPYKVLKQEYESLRQEYESLRQEYESLRYTHNLDTNHNNVWRSQERNNGKQHPTQKPLDLMERIVKTSSKEGGIILDPFMGSGSTGVACINTNRNFIGIEKDDKYFEIAKSRIEKAQQDVAPKV